MTRQEKSCRRSDAQARGRRSALGAWTTAGPLVNLTCRTPAVAAVRPPARTMSTAQDHAVRHQAVVPDKAPIAEYPVSNWPLGEPAMLAYS
jgi:hypothetical protein